MVMKQLFWIRVRAGAPLTLAWLIRQFAPSITRHRTLTEFG
jgi:hypothetical protein